MISSCDRKYNRRGEDLAHTPLLHSCSTIGRIAMHIVRLGSAPAHTTGSSVDSWNSTIDTRWNRKTVGQEQVRVGGGCNATLTIDLEVHDAIGAGSQTRDWSPLCSLHVASDLLGEIDDIATNISLHIHNLRGSVGDHHLALELDGLGWELAHIRLRFRSLTLVRNCSTADRSIWGCDCDDVSWTSVAECDSAGIKISPSDILNLIHGQMLWERIIGSTSCCELCTGIDTLASTLAWKEVAIRRLNLSLLGIQHAVAEWSSIEVIGNAISIDIAIELVEDTVAIDIGIAGLAKATTESLASHVNHLLSPETCSIDGAMDHCDSDLLIECRAMILQLHDFPENRDYILILGSLPDHSVKIGILLAIGLQRPDIIDHI